ncbi:MAG: pyridoxine 5'-phosphate synthase [Marinilabiliales bacterium]|nr:MAG: pyridoxine 5'-phosphate synthase [Marinilabiliales bacterium]
MTRLSVNINKIATLRNARGGHLPDLQKAAIDCERFGAQGITVHPRPDERHITRKDVELIRPLITTEFNIEGNPTSEFIALVLKHKPDQVTLVPDDPNQLTSDHGWDTVQHKSFLQDVIGQFKEAGIRTSIFVDANVKMVEHAKETGTDRVELYTESFAKDFEKDRDAAILPFIEAAIAANELGVGLNAGHDLNLKNLKLFAQRIPGLLEVSIGHALICDALYLGLDNAIKMYLRELRVNN